MLPARFSPAPPLAFLYIQGYLPSVMLLTSATVASVSHSPVRVGGGRGVLVRGGIISKHVLCLSTRNRDPAWSRKPYVYGGT